MNRKSCRGCVYLRRISYSNGRAPFVCHYLLDTNKPRPCSPQNCTVREEEPGADDILLLLKAWEERKKKSDPFRAYADKSRKNPLHNAGGATGERTAK